MKNCKPYLLGGPCMICKDREATVLVQLDKPMKFNQLLCAFCARFPENEIIRRVLKTEEKYYGRI